MGVATASYRKGHCRRHLPAAAVYPHDFQLLVVHRPEQWTRYATDPFGAIARTAATYTFDGGL
jgi:hypothetical protein